MRQLSTVAAANLGRPMPPRLSIDGNRFTLIDSAGNERPHNLLTLDIVIIDLNDHTSKMYWGKEYNPNDTGDIPLCWSDNGQAPSVQSQTPQSPKCVTCPHNVIGSAISKFTQAKIKACVDMKKIAFYIPGEQGIYLMTVKPGSFKNWSAYVNMLKGQKSPQTQGPVELYEVVTQLAFESQGVLKFTSVAWSNMQEAQANYDRGVTPEIVGANDAPWSGQLAAPQAQPQLPPMSPVPPGAISLAPQVQQPVPLSPSAPATTSAGPTPEAPARRQRRTKAQIEADNAAAAAKQVPAQAAPMFTNPQPAPAPAPFAPPQAQPAPTSPQGQAADPNDGLAIPAFLQRNPAPAPAAPPAQQFGLATPAAADPAMLAAIEQAFKLPT